MLCGIFLTTLRSTQSFHFAFDLFDYFKYLIHYFHFFTCTHTLAYIEIQMWIFHQNSRLMISPCLVIKESPRPQQWTPLPLVYIHLENGCCPASSLSHTYMPQIADPTCAEGGCYVASSLPQCAAHRFSFSFDFFNILNFSIFWLFQFFHFLCFICVQLFQLL